MSPVPPMTTIFMICLSSGHGGAREASSRRNRSDRLCGTPVVRRAGAGPSNQLVLAILGAACAAREARTIHGARSVALCSATLFVVQRTLFRVQFGGESPTRHPGVPALPRWLVRLRWAGT